MFVTPPTSGMNATMAFFMAVNFFWAIFTTFTGTSFQSMQAVMSPDLGERSNYLTLGNLGGKLCGAIPGLIPVTLGILVFPPNRAPFMKESSFYTMWAVGICLLGGAAAMATVNLKERVFAPPKKMRLLDNFATFFKNKYFLLLWTVNITNLVQAVGWEASGFFFKDSIGRPEVQTLVWSVGGIPTFLVMMLSPIFLKRFAPRKVVMFSKAVGAACLFGMYLAGKAVGYASPLGIAAVVVFNLISALPSGVADIANNICNINTFDYTEWKTGERAEATTFLISNMLNKGITSLAPLITGRLMGRAGFVSGQPLPQRTKDAMFSFYTISPAIGTLLGIIPYFFYKIEGPMLEQMQRELKERRELTAIKEESLCE
jgi:Na+/melibiose symporter-like transporter